MVFIDNKPATTANDENKPLYTVSLLWLDSEIKISIEMIAIIDFAFEKFIFFQF